MEYLEARDFRGLQQELWNLLVLGDIPTALAAIDTAPMADQLYLIQGLAVLHQVMKHDMQVARNISERRGPAQGMWL